MANISKADLVKRLAEKIGMGQKRGRRRWSMACSSA